MNTKKRNKNYIDKDELWNEIEKYYIEDDLDKADGGDGVTISDTLGSMIMTIAEKLMSARNFSGYPYKDQMIGDAVFCLVRILTKRQFNLRSQARTVRLESVRYRGDLHVLEPYDEDARIVVCEDEDGEQIFFLMELAEDKFVIDDDGELTPAYVKTVQLKAKITPSDNECDIYKFAETGKFRGGVAINTMMLLYDVDGKDILFKNNPFGYMSLAASRSAITRIKKEGEMYEAVNKMREQEYTKFLNENPMMQQQRIDDDTYVSFIE